MNQNRTLAILGGGLMVAIGCLALVTNLVLGGLGLWSPHHILRLWPLTVFGIGLGFCTVPLVVRGLRWLGVLFIPGVIVLYTGAILFFTSVTGWWEAWSWLWPQEVLAVALGFLGAMLYTRSVWFGIPAILVGINGIVFQLCAITGLWEAWAVIWPVEPLAVGLVLLLIGGKVHSPAVRKVGLGICAFSVAAGLGMLAIFAHVWWITSLLFSVMLILAGGGVLSWTLLRGRPQPAMAGAGQGPEPR